MRVVVIALLLVACGGVPAGTTRATVEYPVYQRLTSGFVGCHPSEITITDFDDHDYRRSWIAACRGRELACSGIPPTSFACTRIEPPSAP